VANDRNFCSAIIKFFLYLFFMQDPVIEKGDYKWGSKDEFTKREIITSKGNKNDPNIQVSSLCMFLKYFSMKIFFLK
jgi:hypothetical protein